MLISLVLVQATPLLLLDEPTTFLDTTHLLEVLNLVFRYTSHLIVMKDGAVVAEGRPADIVTAELIEQVYRIPCICVPDPVTGHTMVIPTT